MFYNRSREETLSALNTSLKGLSEGQAEESRIAHGENRLVEKEGLSVIQVFLMQFADLLVLILIGAAVVSMLTGSMESTIVILAVITLNAVLGTVQHVKAEKSLKSLKALSSPKAKVIRDGQLSEIDAAKVVVGDIVLLEAGDLVPADGRIIENSSLQVNESALTGESESVMKTEGCLSGGERGLADQGNMVFSSSQVTYGRATVAVTAVGMDTELGKIAALMNTTKQRETPLQISLDDFSQKLSILIMGICVVVFTVSMYHGTSFLDAMMFAVALAVAAIPEALSSIVTISLAIGTSKMAREHAIIKNLRAVEGLGCVSVICSDKTGTLTQNKMTVQQIFTMQRMDEKDLLTASILCNDSRCVGEELIGDPTENAFLDHYIRRFGDYDLQIAENRRIGELPFDSVRKRMSTLHKTEEGTVLFTKGAVDVLDKTLDFVLCGDGIRPISRQDLVFIRQQNEQMSKQGLRVLAFAKRYLDMDAVSGRLTTDCENHYIFLGLIAMVDPPRVESKAAVRNCRRAGIKPVMITGDHIITASAIAHQIGILEPGDEALTGTQLDALTDEQLSRQLPGISVYARVSPEHKLRIVRLWQARGQIVAMTGDGVNDAPALKKADIGIAMGITGTEVSKEAASMILTDDNFATIIKAVVNGRNIYTNIKNAIKFLLSGNMAGIFSVVYASIRDLPVPFAAVHLLFINLLTDSLPAIAIGMEKPDGDLLKEKPRATDEPILTKPFIRDIVFQGIVIFIFTMVAFVKGLQLDPATGSTMAFATLCMARLWHGFNSRSDKSIASIGLFTNGYSLGAFVLGNILLLSALWIPRFQRMLQVMPLGLENFLFMECCAFIPTVIIQIGKKMA